MHTLKPSPIFMPPIRKVCPICGQPSYSREGIHPQCAIQQADGPRSARLRLKKQAELKKKSLRRGAWK